jgi:hypothetical protein
MPFTVSPQATTPPMFQGIGFVVVTKIINNYFQYFTEPFVGIYASVIR